jgi:16S rRNA (guanine527-N7)-methyltransferase
MTSYDELLAPYAKGSAHERLVRYAELLEHWSGRHSLVRFESREELVARHIVDSLAAAEHLSSRGRLLDVGSGAGLPGVPLLAVRPGWGGLLLEPRQKRWAFLRLVVRELGLDVRVERTRYEALTGDERWTVVSMRAVGRHGEIVRWAREWLDDRGQVMVWTTERGENELQQLDGWRVLSSQLPGLDRGRLVRLRPCST